jgi:uncharacterized phiE125 gp8 family phage protein
MNITIISEPPFEPVTLEQVYTHLRLDVEGSPPEHPHDDMLRRHITSARVHVEQMARRSLVLRTLRLSMASFPQSAEVTSVMDRARRFKAVERILLRQPPFAALGLVQYYDEANALQTLDAANYYTTDEQVPELRFVTAFSAPTVYDRPDAVRVTYSAGYPALGSPPESQADYAANVPKPLCDAILLGVQLLYDQLDPADREAIERTREALVQPFRVQLSL